VQDKLGLSDEEMEEFQGSGELSTGDSYWLFDMDEQLSVVDYSNDDPR
jgi:hypothetical protein